MIQGVKNENNLCLNTNTVITWTEHLEHTAGWKHTAMQNDAHMQMHTHTHKHTHTLTLTKTAAAVLKVPNTMLILWLPLHLCQSQREIQPLHSRRTVNPGSGYVSGSCQASALPKRQWQKYALGVLIIPVYIIWKCHKAVALHWRPLNKHFLINQMALRFRCHITNTWGFKVVLKIEEIIVLYSHI